MSNRRYRNRYLQMIGRLAVKCGQLRATGWRDVKITVDGGGQFAVVRGIKPGNKIRTLVSHDRVD